MGCGAAGAIAAGVAAAGAVGGALISGSASKSAASTEANAANNATLASEQEAAKTQATLAPFVAPGVTATNQLSADLSGQNPTGELTQLENTPGYQFALTQGLESTQNSGAARGLGTSGPALKAAANYAEGLAENTYQTNLLNPLEYLSGQGENAAAQTGQLGTQNIANANQTTVGAANASAAGTVGAANAASGALTTAANVPLNYLLYQNLLNGGANGSGNNGFYVDNTSPLVSSGAV
jgi:hypothetical protein